LTTAAEQAAGTGDFAAAEQHLRLAVELQASAAGPPGPELANTLNNLGVVYEHLERPADAEQCYRRAHAVASAVFDADHPFVALSAKNLQDFCEARGIPIDLVAAEPELSQPTQPEPEPELNPPTQPETAMQPAPRSRTALPIMAGAAMVLILVSILAIRSQSARRPVAPVTPAAETRGADQPEASAKAEAPPPQPSAAPVAPTSAAGAASVGKPAPPVASPKRATPTLSEAALCRSVEIRAGEWLCDPAGGAPEPGTFFFYTRVASAGDATIEHRWYRNDRLYQRVPLRVRANQSGFRTYSRMTISAERAGDWRVVVRTASGDLLREERFTVSP
jgi:tetratricopeptide (TPR) repeat protein